MILEKDGRRFYFEGAINVSLLGDDAARDRASLGLAGFVVEYDDRYLFVEVIDEKNGGRLKSDALCDMLARKYRDSLFFHSFGDCSPKAVEYAVLVASPPVDGILLIALQDELKRRIPFSHPIWQGDSASACWVMNEAQWRKRYGEESLQRIEPFDPDLI